MNKTVYIFLEKTKESKDFICLSSFILTETEIIEELKNAAERNIRIYVLTAPELIISERTLPGPTEGS